MTRSDREGRENLDGVSKKVDNGQRKDDMGCYCKNGREKNTMVNPFFVHRQSNYGQNNYGRDWWVERVFKIAGQILLQLLKKFCSKTSFALTF